MRWHFCTVQLAETRVNRSSIGILSLHLNNVHAKKPQAGFMELGATIDKAVNFDDRHTVDIICGDLNMARWKNHADQWHEGTLNELEMRGFLPIADYVNECCFVAVHERIAKTLHTKGSSWGERAAKLDTEQRKAFHSSFLAQVGAKPTSKDVHWPMPLALRMPVSARASGLRQRSAAATERRNEKKRMRGFGPRGRSSGSNSGSGGSYGRSSGWRRSW